LARDKMKKIAIFLVVAALACPAYCQTPFGSTPLYTRDSLVADSTRRSADTVGLGKATLGKIKIVKRTVDYGKFVALGIGTMVFVALVITTAQAWNPNGRSP